MAKKSSIAKNERRRKLVEKYSEKRQELQSLIKDSKFLNNLNCSDAIKCQSYLEIQIL